MEPNRTLQDAPGPHVVLSGAEPEERSRNAEEIAAMRTLKNAFDPKHILNRGRIFGCRTST